MGERIGNLSRRESMSIFMAILLGLTAVFITAAGPMLASITSASPTPSPQRGANTTQGTKGGNAAGGARGRAAAPCADKTKRYTDCGNGTVTDSVTGLGWVKKSKRLPSPDFQAAKKAVAGLKNGDCMLTDG